MPQGNMATYNAVSQHDHDQGHDLDHLSDDGHVSEGSASPPAHEKQYQPINLQHENLGGSATMDQVRTTEEPSTGRLGSLLRSVASSGGYEMVEADEYDVEDEQSNTLRVNKRQERNGPAEQTDDPHSETFEPSPPLRTASIRNSLPMNSPKPDLQTLQGAYVTNVERLEESAERLSTMSSLEEEIQKLKQEQQKLERVSSAPSGRASAGSRSRHLSASSHTNSIIGLNSAARTGGYSPGGYITSPKGSIVSTSANSQPKSQSLSRMNRLSSLPEPEQEGRPLDSVVTGSPVPLDPPPPPPPHHDFSNARYTNGEAQEGEEAQHPEEEDRPATRASADTVEQAREAFLDFDGVHRINPSVPPSRKSSIHQQPPQTNKRMTMDKRHSSAPQPVPEGMVYYPAPVPVMLNLPQRLSKLPSAAEMERRRLQGISHIPAEARQSAAWLAGDAVPGSGSDLANMPPQLRASVFFDQAALRQDIEIKGGSAVNTLDAILDASAYAPVSAFVDHPFAGPVGAEVYGRSKVKKKSANANKPKRRSSLGKMMDAANGKAPSRMRSSSALTTGSGRVASREMHDGGDSDEAEDEGTPLQTGRAAERRAERSIMPSGDELSDQDEEEEEEDDDDDDDDDEPELYNGPPTTLLAELQLRKEQQRRRTKAPPTILPNGMRATLLEQDTIAQIQKRSRQQKHITLAWEDQDAADQANFDDEDIPLGVLFAGKNKVEEASRPMGLMERREMEENEPLSRRRARLRGEPMLPRESRMFDQRASTMIGLDNSGQVLGENDDENTGETLADRLKRLKAEKGTATLTGDFASEVMTEIVAKVGDGSAGKTPDPEETLGQRRARLRKEAEARKVSGDGEALKSRRSMADLLAAHPVAGPNSRKPSGERKSYMPDQQQFQRQSMLPQPQMAYRQSSMPMLPTMNTFNNGFNQMPNIYQQYQYPGANGFNGMPNNPMYYNPAFGMAMTPNQGMPSMGYPGMGLEGMSYMQQQMYQYPMMMSGMRMAPGMGMNMNMGMNMAPNHQLNVVKQRSQIDQWRQSVVGGGV